MVFFYERKAKEIKVREEESGGVEEEECGKALRKIFKPREQERREGNQRGTRKLGREGG